jgi:hypothetical protein
LVESPSSIREIELELLEDVSFFSSAVSSFVDESSSSSPKISPISSSCAKAVGAKARANRQVISNILEHF